MFFEAFVREWGAWSVSVLSLGVAALAYFNSRRAVRIAATEHEWKSADRVKVLAAEASAAEERAWCERIRLHLEASPDDPIAVADDKLDWALRGDGKYFQVVRRGNLVWVYPADYHVGPVLG